jgi:uncharacterized protein YkwD
MIRFLLAAAIAISFTATPQPAAADDLPPVLGEPYQAEVTSQPDVQPAFAGCGRVDQNPLSAAYEQRILDLVNQERAKNGLPPVKRNPQLDFASRYQARDMMDDNYFGHDTMDLQNGALVLACSISTRLNNYYPTWNYRAENIAAGYATPDDTMTGWMNSTGHRANILSSEVREIGIGFMQSGGTYGRYWVQDFGRSPNVYPLIINQEAASTNLLQVNLFIYGQGVWNEIRLRNDSDGWTNWQPFQQWLSWTMPASAGVHTVSAEMRNSSGSTAASSDTIIVNSTLIKDLPYTAFLAMIKR